MRGSTTTLTFTALLCLGMCWGPWDQGQPEVLPKPSIWADPGTMVTHGSPVTIWCQGSLLADVYHLYKEGDSVYWEAKALQGSRNKAWFHFASSSSSDARQYQCAYQSRNRSSERSDPLPLVVTGLSRAPSLSSQPGLLVLAGDNLTLQCRSEAGFGSFALTKDEGLSPPLRLEGQQSPDFPLGRVSRAHGGQYRCYIGHNSYSWSAPSAPLDILIAGMHRKPSLSARPGASVPQGENVTLQCRSEVRSDTFHLSKEGSLAAPQHLRLQDPAPPVQANFTLRAVTSAHSGTYRCYSSHSTAPHLLSIPSDPLELQVSGAPDSISPPQNKSDSKSDYTVQNLIRMGLAASVLLLLGVLLCQARHDRGGARDVTQS
ncbi:leukocyte immunoglobulin-like receptor subfamily A member 2 isoform X2 [Bos indicus]|uniref:Leukocyte immunoglobulin-like receptor subfamily A member 2 n=2 Tax=Bos TaxID=9903 RepID=A0A4W2GKW8_BOBOX